MKPDKEVKKAFKLEASQNPEQYYAVNALKTEGFSRAQCTHCKKWYWSTHKRSVCGDAECQGGVTLFSKDPKRNKLTYIEVWETYKNHFENRGYMPVKRYPVIAKWNPTTDFTIASIAAFQPYVISGAVEPPAKKLTIPQFCLRFGDIDNVGVTGSHCTGFVMIGQHAFVNPDEWNQEQLFRDIYEYVTHVVGLSKDDLVLHEDAWAGGGNFGPCMEFFSNGIELFNQVYMMFEQSDDLNTYPDGRKELDIKVLDMGLGMERIAWFSQGTTTMYDAAFPTVVEHLIAQTQVDFDRDVFKKFAPYASMLNVDETDDVNKAWNTIAEKTGIPVDTLKAKVLPMTGIYSIAEHTRSLLFAIGDGGLPSNVGGFYNLRVIYRRMMSFIDKFGWQQAVDIKKILRLHAQYLEPVFPELQEAVNEVYEILSYEEKKYRESKERAQHMVESLVAKREQITTEKLIELYDSHGIAPEELKEAFAKINIQIIVPDNFYMLVTEKHEQESQAIAQQDAQGKADKSKTATRREKIYDTNGLNTEALYFEHYDFVDFKGVVTKIIHDTEENNYKVVLDRTAFYPTSGGQIHDTGHINKCKVVDVFKQGAVIFHVLPTIDFKEGDTVHGRIDLDRRVQVTQHHTATHILNGSSRKLLGNHIWQAGAAKTPEKGRLDITHYENLTGEQIQQIEELANKVVKENIPVYKSFMKRNLAEAKYGMRLYQGGAVPGRELRIVDIMGFDVEACAGTHVDITGDVGQIKIIKTSKIQDGVVRIEFTAGLAAEKTKEEHENNLEVIAGLLHCTVNQVPGRVQELFDKWKRIVKKGYLEEFTLTSIEEMDDTEEKILGKAAAILKTQSDQVHKTVERFLREIYEKQDGNQKPKV